MSLGEIDGLWVLEHPELKSDLIFKLEAVLAKNCENGKRNRNPNLKFNAHENRIINFLLLLAYQDLCFLLPLLNILACGTTALLHTCLSIDQWMAVAFLITYSNLNLNIPHKLTMIGTILICIVPGFIFFMSWTFKQRSVYFDVYLPYCLDRARMLCNVIYNHNTLSYQSSS